MFALACKNNLEQRALELVEMLANQQILTMAVKYATKLDRKRLAEKLVNLASKIDVGDDYGDTGNDVSISTPSSVIKPNVKLVLPSSRSSSKYKNMNGQKSTPISSTHSSSKHENSSFSVNQEIPTPSDNKFDTSINTQESLFSEEEPKNPFLKSLKKTKAEVHNPLSLTDKFAGYDMDKKNKENKTVNEGSEKRKKPESTSDEEKQVGKRGRLDKFMFSKKS